MKTLQEKYDSELKKTIIEDWNYYYSKYKKEIGSFLDQNKKG